MGLRVLPEFRSQDPLSVLQVPVTPASKVMATARTRNLLGSSLSEKVRAPGSERDDLHLKEQTKSSRGYQRSFLLSVHEHSNIHVHIHSHHTYTNFLCDKEVKY